MAEPVTPRPSASVILVRDGPTELETFMVRRHAQSPVAPSAYVFPGGTARADDADAFPEDCAPLARALAERSDSPVDPPTAAAFYVTAVRELFEEAGVLLVRDDSGGLLTIHESDQSPRERLASTRLALQARERSLAGVLADFGWQPAFDLLVPFSHWVTPTVLAARFDTRFFVAAMPPGQEALHDTIETSAGAWMVPVDVLEGDYQVVYATAQHLRRLCAFHSVDELLRFAREKSIHRVQPEVIERGTGLSVHIAEDLIDNW